MSSSGSVGDDDRVAELLRVNAELAAEIRSLALGRAEAPRSGTAPTARKVDRLVTEHEELTERIAAVEPGLEAAHARIAHLEAENRELHDLAAAHRAQIAELRAGWRGFARRAAMRLRRGGRGDG